jgi:hypothetical protein
MGVRIKALLGLTAAGVAASTLVPATAEAAGAGFTFCNVSSAPEYVAFPYRGWFASYVEDPGHCWHASLSGVSSDEAVGYRLVNGQWLAVLTRYFSDSGTVNVYF